VLEKPFTAFDKRSTVCKYFEITDNDEGKDIFCLCKNINFTRQWSIEKIYDNITGQPFAIQAFCRLQSLAIEMRYISGKNEVHFLV